MRPQALFRMLLLGAVRGLLPFHQRFHCQFLLLANNFEFAWGTFLFSNLVDSKLRLLHLKSWKIYMLRASHLQFPTALPHWDTVTYPRTRGKPQTSHRYFLSTPSSHSSIRSIKRADNRSQKVSLTTCKQFPLITNIYIKFYRLNFSHPAKSRWLASTLFVCLLL